MAGLPASIGELEPGSVIEFDDISGLPAFEDAVAAEIDPDMTVIQRDAWAGRVAIKDLIRPLKFNGRMSNIALIIMEEPYERLWDARERGIKFTREGGTPRTEDIRDEFFKEEQIPLYQGFHFIADANSSGRGKIGQVQAEVWYLPVPKFLVKDKNVSTKSTSMHGGMSVKRIVSKPVVESEDSFAKLDETSRRVAYEVLSAGLRRPLRQPFHN